MYWINFQIYLLQHIRKHYFIRTCCLFSKLSRTFTVYVKVEIALEMKGIFSKLSIYLIKESVFFKSVKFSKIILQFGENMSKTLFSIILWKVFMLFGILRNMCGIIRGRGVFRECTIASVKKINQMSIDDNEFWQKSVCKILYNLCSF